MKWRPNWWLGFRPQTRWFVDPLEECCILLGNWPPWFTPLRSVTKQNTTVLPWSTNDHVWGLTLDCPILCFLTKAYKIQSVAKFKLTHNAGDDGSLLNGRWFFKSIGIDPSQQGFSQVHVIKGVAQTIIVALRRGKKMTTNTSTSCQENSTEENHSNYLGEDTTSANWGNYLLCYACVQNVTAFATEFK